MKNILLLLFVILIFAVCAVLGFNIAAQQQSGSSLPQASGSNKNQHNFIIVMVDQYQQPGAQLKSVWFASLYAEGSNPPELAFSQLYVPQSASTFAKELGEKFSIDTNGDPGNDFWNVIRAKKIDWENYVVVDQLGASKFIEWLIGQNWNSDTFAAVLGSPEQSGLLVQAVCQSLTGTVGRESSFPWRELVPGHFRSGLRLEDGQLYWEQAAHSGAPTRCEMLPSP